MGVSIPRRWPQSIPGWPWSDKKAQGCHNVPGKGVHGARGHQEHNSICREMTRLPPPWVVAPRVAGRGRGQSLGVCFGVAGKSQQGASEPSLSLPCQHSKSTEPRPPPQGQTHQTFLRQGHVMGMRQGRVRTLQLRALGGAEIQAVMSVRTVAKAPCRLVFRSVVQSLCPALVVLCF